MKKQKQLNLKNLTIKSFVTTVNNEDNLKGGTLITASLIVVFCSNLPDNSGQFGPACQSQYPNCGSGQIPIENKY